ncbi:MAG: class C sortase [Clostridiales bacterium]|nr:class C sortase [Clostridiales bacterium]
MKKHWSTIVLVLIFLFGISLLLYPTVSNYWNSFHMSRVIEDYEKALDNLDSETYRKILNSAKEYNDLLAKTQSQITLPDNKLEEYNNQLSVAGSTIMGYIEIPEINVDLPIYHGTSDSALRYGTGHLNGTSLPIGGESSHCVICGHRGLASARLFTDLDRLTIGDEFTLYILDDTYTYEVCDIYIVEPNDVSKLLIEDGEDYCTLYTCTPYGINTQRLLIRGRNISSYASHIRVSSEAYKIDSYIAAPIFAIPLLFILLIWLIISTGKNKKGGDDTFNDE